VAYLVGHLSVESLDLMKKNYCFICSNPM